ncbi:MAG TPA: GyrI-like domain-containing protein [Opitutaceae bacterium]|jgi:AraC family transcriptional regulator|nr:GyrI-like domain-containing protein [Opitutaceae bacterium]
MQHTIVSLPELTLLGIEARFIGALSPGADNLVVIPQLWNGVHARRKEIGNALDKYSYGAAKRAPVKQRKHPGEFIYLAGFSVSSEKVVPEGMAKWVVPAQTYALFTHKGPVSRLSETISRIYRVWLPRSKYEAADGPEIERCDERFKMGSATSETDFLVPIKPKSARPGAASRRQAPL